MSSGRMKEISMLKEEGRRSKKGKGNVFFFGRYWVLVEDSY